MVRAMVHARLTQLALVPVRLIGRLGISRARAVTGVLAPMLRLFMARRRRIVEKNLAWCFPEASASERRSLRDRHFRHLAESVGEIAVVWTQTEPISAEVGEVVGLEHIIEAQSQGFGVLMVTGHTVCLELAARLTGEALKSSGIYRPLSNPTLERFQNRGRARYAEQMFRRDDLRAMVRHLRAGEVLWYAPDQDFGPKLSEFVPFFGIETATVRALPELARLGRAQVVGMYPIKDEDSGKITVHIGPVWQDFPSSDVHADLARFNAFLEDHIRQAPAQYWWLHRRFKTTPDGVSRY